MTLDEVLAGLFPSGHQVKVGDGGLITGSAKRKLAAASPSSAWRTANRLAGKARWRWPRKC